MFGFVKNALVLLSVAGAALAQERGTCYSPAVPAPAVRSQTIVLIDLTTARASGAIEDFKRTAARAAAIDGQRYVVLTFAGLARSGQHVQLAGDYTIEAPIADRALQETLPIKPFKKSQACVAAAQARWASAIPRAVAETLAAGADTDYRQSQILFAVRETLREFAKTGLTTRLLVYSDGLQHGGGLSFYERRTPRRIDARSELAKVPAAVRAAPAADPGSVSVLWFGLMARGETRADAAATARAAGYYEPEALAQLQRFWSTLLAGWGASNVQIGPTLLNPQIDDEDAQVARGRRAEPGTLVATRNAGR